MKKSISLFALIFLCFEGFAQNFQWVKTIEGDFYYYPQSLVKDEKGNLCSFGRKQGTIFFDSGKFKLEEGWSYFAKHTTNGNFLWAISFVGEQKSLHIDSIGNIYFTGLFSDKGDFNTGSGTEILNSEGGKDVFILKLDSKGNYLWAKRIGGKNDETVSEIEALPNGDILVSGAFSGLVDFDPGPLTQKINGSGNFRLRLDSSGNYISVDVNYTQSLKPLPMATDKEGNNYFTGFFTRQQDFDPDPNKTFLLSSFGDRDIYVQKLDSTGKLVWAKRIGGLLTDMGNSMIVDSFQNVYITGSFEDSVDFDPGTTTFYLGSVGKTDAFILKLDSLGNFVWARSIGGADKDEGRLIVFDRFSNLNWFGNFQDTVHVNSGTENFLLAKGGSFLIKIDSSGIIDNALEIPGYTSSIFDSAGNIYLHGIFYGSVDFDPGLATRLINSKGTVSIFILKLGPCPSPIVPVNGPTTFCGSGSKATYSIIPASGANGYKWTVPEGSKIDSGQNTTSIYVTFGTTSGNVTVIPANACDTSMVTVLPIKINPLPKVEAIASANPVCIGNFVTLTGKGALNYVWSDGVKNGISFKPFGPIKRTVTGTDVNGCSDTASIWLDIAPFPVIDMHPITQMKTIGSNAIFVVSTPSPTAKFLWQETIGNNYVTLNEYGQYSGVRNDTLKISDVRITKNIYSYRCIVHEQGCSTTSNSASLYVSGVGIQESLRNSGINIYPNPNYGRFEVHIENPENESVISVYNAVGQLVAVVPVQEGQTTYPINLEVSNGIYLVKIANGGMTFCEQVVVR